MDITSSEHADIVDIFARASSTPSKVARTTGLNLFKGSNHPARPTSTDVHEGRGDLGAWNSVAAGRYAHIADREQFEQQAKDINAARRASAAAYDESKAVCVLSLPQ